MMPLGCNPSGFSYACLGGLVLDLVLDLGVGYWLYADLSRLREVVWIVDGWSLRRL